MKKKILAGILSMTVMMSLTGFSQIATAEGVNDAGYELLYENTFDDGAAGGISVLNQETEHFILIAAQKGGWNTVTFDGNTGVATNEGAWPSGRNLCFDFTKGGIQSGISKGIYKVSFEFSPRVTGGGDTLWTGMNMPDHYNGGRLMRTYMKKEDDAEIKYLNVLANVGNWSGGAVLRLDHELKYKVDMVFDLANKKVATYINDEHFGDTVINSKLDNFTINLCGYWDYFDNLIVEKWDAMNPKHISINEDGVVLEYPERFKNTLDFAGMYYKNIYTGEVINAEATDLTYNSFIATPEKALVGGYEYELHLPEGIEGECSGKSEVNTLEFNFGGMGTIKSFKTKDFDGNVSKLQDENTTLLEGFVIEFAEGMNAADYIGTLKIADDVQNEVLYTAKCSDNVANITFVTRLLGHKIYNVTIDDLAVPYNIIVKTGEGGIIVKPAKLYKEDGVTQITSLSEISAGDKIKAKFEVINAGEGSFSYLASVTMYNGKKMTGIDFENVVLESGMRKTTEAELTVSDVSDLKINGFLWHPEKTIPVNAPLEFTFE